MKRVEYHYEHEYELEKDGNSYHDKKLKEVDANNSNNLTQHWFLINTLAQTPTNLPTIIEIQRYSLFSEMGGNRELTTMLVSAVMVFFCNNYWQ